MLATLEERYQQHRTIASTHQPSLVPSPSYEIIECEKGAGHETNITKEHWCSVLYAKSSTTTQRCFGIDDIAIDTLKYYS